MNEEQLTISASGGKQYTVDFIGSQEALERQIAGLKNPVLFVDDNIHRLWPDLMHSLGRIGPLHPVLAREENKTLSGATQVLESLAAAKAGRQTAVVAIGGGIVQDIVSFAAHVYYRGLRFVYVPTTLLAMCDSCIGGKSGLNFNGYKNQLGAFHPPEKVLIWDAFLKTLPDEALYSGYGEIFKFMLIGGAHAFDRFREHFHAEGIRSPAAAGYIHQGLNIKKTFIEEDEFDNGVRRILNYGHTFGHAIELATDYRIPHGIAVAFGIDIANHIAVQKGYLARETAERVQHFIKDHFPFDVFKGLTAEILLESVAKDKKAAEGKVDMILLEEPGQFRIESILIDKLLNDIVRGYLADSLLVSV